MSDRFNPDDSRSRVYYSRRQQPALYVYKISKLPARIDVLNKALDNIMRDEDCWETPIARNAKRWIDELKAIKEGLSRWCIGVTQEDAATSYPREQAIEIFSNCIDRFDSVLTEIKAAMPTNRQETLPFLRFHTLKTCMGTLEEEWKNIQETQILIAQEAADNLNPPRSL